MMLCMTMVIDSILEALHKSYCLHDVTWFSSGKGTADMMSNKVLQIGIFYISTV